MARNPKTKSLSRAELYRKVWSTPLTVVAKELGISGNALTKICNRLLVPYPQRGYWARANAGKTLPRPPLPPAPEHETKKVVISSSRAPSRRRRTRLSPAERREHLLATAKGIIRKEGLAAASMKRLAAEAGISETLAYNYFSSRDQLFLELARSEYAQLRANRQAEIAKGTDHYSQITLATSAYLRQIDQRGVLLHMLLMSSAVRDLLRSDRLKQQKTELPAHAQHLVDTFGLPHDVAIGVTVVLSRLSLRAGSLIADQKAPLAEVERLCLNLVLSGSRAVVAAYGKRNVRSAQGREAA